MSDGNGETFTPVVEFKKRMVTYTLPESMWSALLVLFLPHEFFFTRFDLVPLAAVFIFGVIVQITFVVELFNIVQAAEHEITEPSNLSICCIATLVGSVQGGELRHCYNMFQWVRLWPGHGWGEKVQGKPAPDWRKLIVKRKVYRTQDQDFDYWVPAGYIDLRDRLLIYFFLSARVTIAVCVLVYGSGHVLFSKDAETQILNTVGVVFVLEIMEYFYRVAAPSSVRHTLQELPPIGSCVWKRSGSTTFSTYLSSQYGGLASMTFFALLTLSLVHFWGATDVLKPIMFLLGAVLVVMIFAFTNFCRYHDGQDWPGLDTQGAVVGRLSTDVEF
jgi:hypothetical protein